MKRIILTGGGTGGHITPLLAVAHQLKKLDPSCHVIYIGEKGGKFASMTHNNPDIDEVRTIYAGKFRRYYGESWLTRVFAVKTNLLNLRDFFLFGIGTLQSLVLIKRLKPSIVLLKGGFVGVPVGLSAAFWRLPFITHDSDTVPGLANRSVSKWATYHATGMPAEYYNYPEDSVRFVGVLVGEKYQTVTKDVQDDSKARLGVKKSDTVLLVTGGSGGAAVINKAVRSIVQVLLEQNDDLYVFHQVGMGKQVVYDGYHHDRLKVFDLLNPMHVYTAAADIVITRAGANTMAELGVQGRACVVIPNPLLTGGHQLKNAAVWQEQGAAKVIDEVELKKNPELLLANVKALLDNPQERARLGKNLEKLTVKNAARKLAELLLESGGPGAGA